jgi:hypothetical protein
MSDFTDNPPERRDRNNDETDFPVPAQLPPLEKGISGKERLMTLIAAAIVAALVSTVMVFGLRAFQGHVAIQNPGLQQGENTVPAQGTLDVYYKQPYKSPPHLTITGNWVEIVEQKEDHFKIKNTFGLPASFQWKAEGRPVD